MADNQSLEALQVDRSKSKEMEEKKLQFHLHGGNGNQQEKDDEEGEERLTDRRLQSGKSQLVQSESSQQPQSGVRLKDVKMLQGLGNDQSSGMQVSNTATESKGEAQLKEQTGACDEETVVMSVVEVDRAKIRSQVQLSVSPTPLSDHRSSSPKVNSFCSETDQKSHFNGKVLTPVSVGKRSTVDGYNWRKYGQKQVKSPTGSRSYYRCTNSECSAKKIENCNHLGLVLEVVYRNHHSHDPPKKVNSSKETMLTPSTLPLIEIGDREPIRTLCDIGPFPASKEIVSPKELVQLTPSTPERKRNVDNGEAKGKKDHVNKLELKRRVKIEDLTCSDTESTPGKKPKFVVHAMGDAGISGDGYRWRKYGQKMVKGNPEPRNYYRCTSAGCPVRKQIERALDNTDAIMITYKGVHDHDMPVPKKRHGPSSRPLAVAAVPISSMNNSQLKRSETKENQISSTQGPTDKEGELKSNAKDHGGEKAIESARTLLSIGFEIKHC